MNHKINNANIKEWAKNYDGELFDGILCDPPYELGFMGKSWDSSGIAFDQEMWADIYKLLKPGGHLLAFSGSRTYHRMAVAIEDAGFEIRDMIEWVYGQGFPKALDVNKQLNTCKCSGNAVPYNHDRTTEKPEHNLRPLRETNISQTEYSDTKQGQVLQSSVSEQSTHRTEQGQEPSKRTPNGEESSLERWDLHRTRKGLQDVENAETPTSETERLRAGTHSSNGTDDRQTTTGRGRSTPLESQASRQQTRESETIRYALRPLDGESLSRCSECQRPILQEGVKTALKPAHEPCVLARKPLEKGMTVATNALKHGTGGLNIDGTRIGTEVRENNIKDLTNMHKGGYGKGGYLPTTSTVEVTGRFPSNLIHDGSDEVVAVFPNDNQRFFYCSKSSKSERNAGLEGFEERTTQGMRANAGPALVGEDYVRTQTKNHHPTVKPLSLTKYLATLIKPPTGGRLLVPFSGSGSEMIGALQAGWEYVEGVELTEEYIPIAEARIKYWLELKAKENPQLELI